MFPENNYGIIHLIGDDSKVDTPLPIPNREVKHFNGENSVSEDSKLPIFFCSFFVSSIAFVILFNILNRFFALINIFKNISFFYLLYVLLVLIYIPLFEKNKFIWHFCYFISNLDY